MWKSAEAGGAGGPSSNPGYDPLMEDLQKTGKAGKDFFEDGKRATEVCLQTGGIRAICITQFSKIIFQSIGTIEEHQKELGRLFILLRQQRELRIRRRLPQPLLRRGTTNGRLHRHPPHRNVVHGHQIQEGHIQHQPLFARIGEVGKARFGKEGERRSQGFGQVNTFVSLSSCYFVATNLYLKSCVKFTSPALGG